MIKSLSIPIGRLWQTEVRLHLTFLLPFLFVIIPEADKGIPEVLSGFELCLLLLVAVVLHEIAHIVVARWRKLAPRMVVLLPLGGVTLREAAEGSREMPASEEVRIALAGPLSSLLIG